MKCCPPGYFLKKLPPLFKKMATNKETSQYSSHYLPFASDPWSVWNAYALLDDVTPKRHSRDERGLHNLYSSFETGSAERQLQRSSTGHEARVGASRDCENGASLLKKKAEELTDGENGRNMENNIKKCSCK